jgi:hypothetical protein
MEIEMQFRVNERVEVTRPVSGDSVGGMARRKHRDEGDEGTVTRANSTKSLVRFIIDPGAYFGGDQGFSIWIPNDALVSIDDHPSDPDAVRPRRLGEKPEGEEFISPTDPRLEWFWDDVSAFAAKSQYCGTFDTILKALGAPARKQLFRPTIVFNGLNISGEVMARSIAEADKMLREQLADAVTAEAVKMAEV